MTGATVFIIYGDSVVIGKVRHDGFELEDIMKDLIKEPIDETKSDSKPHVGFWMKTYLKFLEEMMGYDVTYEIESIFQYTGFETTKKGTILDTLTKIPLEDDFSCSYGDYMYVIDLDNKTITEIEG